MEISDVIHEIRSTRVIAERLASEGLRGSDATEALAGLIGHLAEQMDKLATESQRHTDDGR